MLHGFRHSAESPLKPVFSRMTFANSSASSVPTWMIFRPSVSFTQPKPQTLIEELEALKGPSSG
jgi:hypothetical protein